MPTPYVWTVQTESNLEGKSLLAVGFGVYAEVPLPLPAPTNAQTVASGGNRALVSWDWSAEGEPE